MKKYNYCLGLIVLVCLFLVGCATIGYIKMDVKAYSDPERDILALKRFGLVPFNKENPLLEKELLFMVKDRLIRKGYIYDEKNPDFLVAIGFYCGPFQYYVPPTTLYLPHWVPGETKTYTGHIGTTHVYGTEQSSARYESKPYTVGGYTSTAYYRNIQLYFVDCSKLIQSEKVEVIWQGEVDSSGSNSDIRVVAPYLLDEVLGEFPIKTGKSNKRTVNWPGR